MGYESNEWLFDSAACLFVVDVSAHYAHREYAINHK